MNPVSCRARRAVCGVMAVGAAVLSLASTAGAAQLRIWSCHGPEGQPLGAANLQSSATGDGAVRDAPLGGCSSSAAGAGVQAVLQPSAGTVAAASSALFSFSIPLGLTPTAVTMPWVVDGMTPGTAPVGLRARALAGATVLSDVSSDAAGGLAPAGPAGAALPERQITVVLRCAGPAPCESSAPSPGAASVTVPHVAVTATDAVAPAGSAYLTSDPVRDRVLRVRLSAEDLGVGLGQARVLIDGQPAATADLSGGCTDLQPGGLLDLSATGLCQARVTAAPIDINVAALAEGPHSVQVVVADAVGNEATLMSSSFVVFDPPRTPQQTSVTLGLNAGGPAVPTSPATGGGSSGGSVLSDGGVLTETAAGRACEKPRLSVMMVTRPSGVYRSWVLVRRGTTVFFRGRVTCLVNGKRVAPPTGTQVRVSRLRSRGGFVDARRPVLRRDGTFRWFQTRVTSRTLRFSIVGVSAPRAEKVTFRLRALTRAELDRQRRATRR